MHIPQSQPETNYRLVLDAIAGALSGCIARVVVGPLDVVKIRFQVQLEPIGGHVNVARSKYTGLGQAFATIVREEGIQGLWRGTVPGLLLTVPYTSVQFVALHQCKNLVQQAGLADHPGISTLVSFASGAVAGAAGTLASYPFDLLRTTLAAQGEPKVHRGMWDAAVHMWRTRGVTGLYSGLGVTLVEIMPYAALQFGTYDALNTLWDTARVRVSQPTGDGGTLPGQEWIPAVRVQQFCCGLMAGLLAKLTTHPLDVAKKRYQVAGLQRSLSYGARVDSALTRSSLAACISEIYTREGLRGLWKGSLPSIIKAAPSAAITFVAYEAVLAALLRRAVQGPPRATLQASGALSEEET